MRLLIPALLGLLLTACATVAPTPPAGTPAPAPASSAPTQPDSTAPTAPNAAPYSTPPASAPARPPTRAALIRLAEVNDERLLDLYPGMPKTTALVIMNHDETGGAPNPFRIETVADNDRTYEIYYYLTREPRSGRPVTYSMLTPILFEGDRLAVIGRYPIRRFLKPYCVRNPKAVQCVR
jgi:hypothetical protein